MVLKAYEFAKAKHGSQTRMSGEPYIIHPVQVAYILAGLELDESTICAALLHDVLEDTDVTQKDIVSRIFARNLRYGRWCYQTGEIKLH